MKVFIPSRGRAKTIRTHRLLFGADVFVLLHNFEELARYRRNLSLLNCHLRVTGVPFDIALQRQFVLDNYVKDGEWFLFMDDNINNIDFLAGPWWNEQEIEVKKGRGFDNPLWRRRFKAHYDWPGMEAKFAECIEEAERRNVWLVGFSSNHNPMFRLKKWREFGFVNAKMMLVKNGPSRFQEAYGVKCDYGFTVENLLNHGRVLINNFIYPDGQQGQRGGCGDLLSRMPKNRLAARNLMEDYPGLFRYRNRPDRPPLTEIVFNPNTLPAFQKWAKNFSRKKFATFQK